MFSKLGDMEYKGADTPLMVADTPDIERSRGGLFARVEEGARSFPATFNSMPGAKALRLDAPFDMDAMFVVAEAPTTKTTSAATYGGDAFIDVTVTVAW